MNNDYEVRGDITVIFLNRRDGQILEAIIDTLDLDKVKLFPNKWCAYWNRKSKSFYGFSHVGGRKNTKRVWLHRYITDTQDGLLVDHFNNEGLDNRRCNLRLVTNTENMQNRKRDVKNVYWRKDAKKWEVSMQAYGKRYRFGYFDSFEEANRVAKEERAKLMPYSKEGSR